MPESSTTTASSACGKEAFARQAFAQWWVAAFLGRDLKPFVFVVLWVEMTGSDLCWLRISHCPYVVCLCSLVQPLRLEVKKKLSSRSDRVKAVDMHPDEPWVLAALYNGHVFIWNYETQNLVKSFEITELPVRCAKFITRKQWFTTSSDDMHIRIFNYNTMEKIKAFEAHTDYIRYLEVHSTQPYLLSASDDMQIKLWYFSHLL